MSGNRDAGSDGATDPPPRQSPPALATCHSLTIGASSEIVRLCSLILKTYVRREAVSEKHLARAARRLRGQASQLVFASRYAVSWQQLQLFPRNPSVLP